MKNEKHTHQPKGRGRSDGRSKIENQNPRGEVFEKNKTESKNKLNRGKEKASERGKEIREEWGRKMK